MKTEHDFFSDYIDEMIGDENITQVNRYYNLVYDFLMPQELTRLVTDFFKIQENSLTIPSIYTRDHFLPYLKRFLRLKLIDRIKATLHADDRFTPQEVRNKSWEFEQEYKDKELDLDEIGGDLDEYTTRIVNECYRPPTQHDED